MDVANTNAAELKGWLCLQDGKGNAQLTRGHLNESYFTLHTTQASTISTESFNARSSSVLPAMSPLEGSPGPVHFQPAYLSVIPPHPQAAVAPSQPEVIAHTVLFGNTSGAEILYEALTLSAPVSEVAKFLHMYIELLLSDKLEGSVELRATGSTVPLIASKVVKYCEAVLAFTSFVLDDNILISIHRLASLLGSVENSLAEKLKLKIVNAQEAAQKRLQSCLTAPRATSTSPATSAPIPAPVSVWNPYLTKMASLEDGIPFELFMASGFIEDLADQIAIFHRRFWKHWSPLQDPALLFHDSYFCDTWMRNPLVFDSSRPHFLAYLLSQHVFSQSISDKIRAKLIENWIKLASLLREKGDSVGWIGIILTLFSPPVLRLTSVWWYVDNDLIAMYANDWGFETFELHKRSEIPFLQKKSFRTDTENVGNSYSKEDCVPYFHDAINFDHIDEISPENTERKLNRIQLICDGWQSFIESIEDKVEPSSCAPDQGIQALFGNWVQQTKPEVDFRKESMEVKPRVLGHYLVHFYNQSLPLTNNGLLPILFAEEQNLFRIYPRATLLLVNQPKSSSRPKTSVRRSSSFPPLSHPETTGVSELDLVSREQLELAASAHILVDVVKDLLNVGTEKIDTHRGIVFKTVPTDPESRRNTRNSSIVESFTREDQEKRAKGKPVVVKSANLVRLVDVLLLGADVFVPNVRLNIDLHTDTLLATYRNMCSSSELLDILQQRLISARRAARVLETYNPAAPTGPLGTGGTAATGPVIPSTNSPLDNLWVASTEGDKVNDMAVHIVNTILKVLQKWIEGFFFDFMDDDGVLETGQQLLNLIRTEIADHDYPEQLLAKCKRVHGAFYHHQFSLAGLTKGLPSWHSLLSNSNKKRMSRNSFARMIPEMPCHGATIQERVNSANSYIDELNNIVTDAFSRITIADWVQLGEILEQQTVSPLGFFPNKPFTGHGNSSTSESEVIVEDIYNWLSSLSTWDTKLRLLEYLPESIVAFVKLHMGMVSYFTLQFSEPKLVHPQDRKDRMVFAHIMLGVMRSRMKFFDLSPESDGQQQAQHVPSFLERSLIAAIIRPESRAHAAIWLAAGAEVSRNFHPVQDCKGQPNEEFIFIPELPTTKGEPLSPCVGWIIERILEIICCVPNTSLDHPTLINFDKQRYFFNLISNLFTEFQPQNAVNCSSELLAKHSYLFNDHARLANIKVFLVDRKHLKESIQKEGKTRTKVFSAIISQEMDRQALENRQQEKLEKARERIGSFNSGSNSKPNSAGSLYNSNGSESSLSLYSKRFSKLIPSSSSSVDITSMPSNTSRHSASKSQVSISAPLSQLNISASNTVGVPNNSTSPPISTSTTSSKRSASPGTKKSRFGGFFKNVRPLSVLSSSNSSSNANQLPHQNSQKTINSMLDNQNTNITSAMSDLDWVADDSIHIDNLNPVSSIADSDWKPLYQIDLSTISTTEILNPSGDTFGINYRTGGKRLDRVILRAGSPEIAKNWIQSISSAVNKRLLNSTLVFGVPIEVVCTRENSEVPLCLETLLQQIEHRGLEEVGVYRIPGSLAAVNGLKQAFDQGETKLEPNDPRWSDINAIAGCIKLYMRDLPEPIFTSALLPQFLALVTPAGVPPVELKKLLSMLPKHNYAVLKRLVKHLSMVVQHSDVNKMNLQNIVIVFGVNFLPPMAVTQMGVMQQILSCLILQMNELFD